MKIVEGWELKSVLGAMSLLFCGLAHAQSNVTLYGVVDGRLLYTSKTLNTVTGQNGGKTFAMNDSGRTSSRFGLEGAEDLGGGLKVNFKLESGINIATAATRIRTEIFSDGKPGLRQMENLGRSRQVCSSHRSLLH